jgi:hypothetical protein
LRGVGVIHKLLGPEHELAIRRPVERAAAGVVVGVNDERPFHRNGFVLVVVEVQPAAEPARGGLARRVQHRIGPDGDQPLRVGVLRLVFFGPRDRSLEVQRGAARRREEQADQKKAFHHRAQQA